MADKIFKHRGMKFHRFDFEVRKRSNWYVFVSAYENSGKKPNWEDSGRFGHTRSGEFSTPEEAAEVALERLNRLLIEDGECPLEFAEGSDVVSAGRESFTV